jgi:MFS family permease
MPVFASQLTPSYRLVGLVLAGEALGMIAADLPSGLILHRLGQRRAMLIGLGASALATAALFLAGNIPAVLLLRLFSGAGQALFAVARQAFISERLPVAGRGQSVALVGGVWRLGRFLGPLAGGGLAALAGLQAAFLLGAGLLLLIILILLISPWIDTPHPPADQPILQTTGLKSLLLAWRENAAILMSAGTGALLMMLVRSGPPNLIPLYADRVLGLDVAAVGVVVSLGAGLDLISFLPAGWLMDRFGRKASIIPSLLGMSAGLALIPLAQDFSGLLLASCAAGIGNGIGSGTLLTLGADLAPAQRRGEFLGAWNLIGDAGIVGAPLLVGAIADQFSLPAAAGCVALAGLAGAGVFFWGVRETLPKTG